VSTSPAAGTEAGEGRRQKIAQLLVAHQQFFDSTTQLRIVATGFVQIRGTL